MPDGLMLWLIRRRLRLWLGCGCRESLSGLSGRAWKCGKRRPWLFSLGSFGTIVLNLMALRLLVGYVMGWDSGSVDLLVEFGKTGVVLSRRIKRGVFASSEVHHMEIFF